MTTDNAQCFLHPHRAHDIVAILAISNPQSACSDAYNI